MALAASRLRRPHSRGDGPPVFSHDFMIQNHADIISCVCVVIFLGLIPQVHYNTHTHIYIYISVYVCIYSRRPIRLHRSSYFCSIINQLKLRKRSVIILPIL